VGITRSILEVNTPHQLGISILPAVLLHGSFDYSLLVIWFMGIFVSESQTQNDDEFASVIPGSCLFLISFSLVMFICILIYSGMVGIRQRRRLRCMEEERTISDRLV